ncbi:PspA/IM30 family protein [Corallococcus coralloides]|uniref:PspA/IM30 family protein n=1 Tax=Corallococcus coralloides TaxID=184914 RepID=UPI00384F5AF7
MSPPSASCPRCGAPRVAGPECPACGVIYLRAEARAATRQAEARDREAREAAQREAEDQRAALREALEAHTVPTFASPLAAARPATEPSTEGITFHPGGELSDGALEARLRLAVLPVALVGAWFAVQSPFFHFLIRTFLTMPVHELGHAVTAWFCGYSATPTLWVTHVSPERSTFVVLLLSGLLGALVWQGWKRRRWAWMGVGAVLLAALGAGRFGLSPVQARALIYFGGDAGRMVLGTLLMATFFVPPGHYLHRHQLRWGFVVIGAAALMDSFEMWWAARTHVDRIPFGRVEGAGLSDPSALVDVYGWNISRVIHWNVNVGLACLAALAALYVVFLWRARDVLRG